MCLIRRVIAEIGCSVLCDGFLAALGLAEEECTDVREGTALANRGVGDQLIHILIVSHGHREVLWRDCLLFVLVGAISG